MGVTLGRSATWGAQSRDCGPDVSRADGSPRPNGQPQGEHDRPPAPRFGVALFDNARDMSVGWACRHGDEPFRFGSVNELSNDTIWVTSLDWDEYRLRAQKLSHLRRYDYLRSSLSQIAADLGWRLQGRYAAECSRGLAQVLHQAMQISMALYGMDDPGSDLREDVLSEDLRRMLAPAPKAQQHLRSQLLSAFQAYSSPDWPPHYEDNTITLSLRFNRLEYAQKILSSPVPDDGWVFIGPEQAGTLSLDALLDPERPSLVEGVLDLGDVAPDSAALLAFGAQIQRRNGLRKWISQPEMLWLTRHAKVRVSSALVASSARQLPAAARLPAKMTGDPLFSLSYSAGLVAEAHWSALTQPAYNRGTRKNEVSSWGVWLRAVDRALSFGLAQRAHEAGMRVVGYGNGAVVVRFERGKLPQCLSFAMENGVAYPAFRPLFLEHGIEVME